MTHGAAAHRDLDRRFGDAMARDGEPGQAAASAVAPVVAPVRTPRADRSRQLDSALVAVMDQSDSTRFDMPARGSRLSENRRG